MVNSLFRFHVPEEHGGIERRPTSMRGTGDWSHMRPLTLWSQMIRRTRG